MIIKMRHAFNRRMIFPAFLLILGLAALPSGAQALDDFSNEPALTQADIDGYIHLTPRLLGEAARNPDTAARLLDEARLSRRRAVYVGAKIAVTQAMVTGALSPDHLDREKVPLYLRPSAEELSLVQRNLTSLTQAQLAASRAAGR